VSWDAERGVTELLGFTHGDGPAAQWLRQVAAGEVCEVFGPRKSIDLRAPAGPVVFVGDESSVALACALRTVPPDVAHVFEARHPAGLTEVLAALGLDAQVVEKTADRAELLRLAREAAGPATLVVTGDAATVHAVRRDSRTWPRAPREVKGKAYWAAGRTGLD
jgi:NADPH-dependent ferric siderophore reductase